MLKAHQGAEIDIVDRLPTPFGLVRSGVAPDHPETKVNPYLLLSYWCLVLGNLESQLIEVLYSTAETRFSNSVEFELQMKTCSEPPNIALIHKILRRFPAKSNLTDVFQIKERLLYPEVPWKCRTHKTHVIYN